MDRPVRTRHAHRRHGDPARSGVGVQHPSRPRPEPGLHPRDGTGGFAAGQRRAALAAKGEWERVKRLDTPLCQGDRLRTGPNSRAALFIPPENLLRVDQNTTVSVHVEQDETIVEFFIDESLPQECLWRRLRHLPLPAQVQDQYPVQLRRGGGHRVPGGAELHSGHRVGVRGQGVGRAAHRAGQQGRAGAGPDHQRGPGPAARGAGAGQAHRCGAVGAVLPPARRSAVRGRPAARALRIARRARSARPACWSAPRRWCASGRSTRPRPISATCWRCSRTMATPSRCAR